MPSLMQAAGWAIGTAWMLASGFPAASAGVAGPPVLGYAFDPGSRAIRPVIGVPGSAMLDGALASASKIETAFVAPGRQFAIAAMRGGPVAVLRWRGATTVEPVSIEGAPDTLTLAAFSSGEFAATYSKDAARVQVWRGLPDLPSLAWEVAAGDVQALAISADGAQVAAAGTAGVTVYSESSAKLAAGGDFTAVVFLPGTHDILAAERDSCRLTGAAGLETCAGRSRVVTSLAVSRDGSTLVVAGEGELTLVRLADLASVSTDCDFKPAYASLAASDTGFLITTTEGATWVLDRDSGEPRLVFAGGAQ